MTTLMNNTVSMTALIKRINRKLQRDNEVLRKARGGIFYVIKLDENVVIRADNEDYVTRMNVEPVALGRTLGVLRENETVP